MAMPAFAQVSGSQAQGAADPGQEIVVTARKRDERLQDVPVSVTAFTGDTLEKKDVKTVEGTLGITPGLYVTGTNLSPSRDFRQLVIRGVGANSQLEPSVATFVDGVYVPGLDFDTTLLDVDRVEILKGPQGALFGRNTEGGAVNIVTRKPTNTFTGRLGLTVDEFDTAQVSGSASGPLVQDKVFASLTAMYRYSDYYVKQNGTSVVPPNRFYPGQDLLQKWNSKYTDLSPANGQHQQFVRGALRFITGDTSEINATAHYSHFKGIDQAPGPLASCHCYTVDGDQAFAQESESYGASLQGEKRFDAFKVNLILGYEHATSSAPYDFDGTSYRRNNYHDFDRRQKSESAELRFSSTTSSRLQWLAGLYYFHDVQFNDRFYSFSNMDDDITSPQSSYDGLWNQQLTNIKRNGYAGFGQLTYELTDKIELAVGGRYSHEKANVSALERFEFMPNGVITSYLSSLSYGWADFYTPVKRDASFNNFSPQGSIRYKFSPNLMAYVSVSRGFKAGSYQTAPVAPSDVTAIKPEKTTNYEAGFKGSLLDGKFTFDVSGYHIDITNQQLQSAVTTGNITVSAITNASKSRVDGFEGSFVAKPFRGLTLNGNVALTRGRFVDYKAYNGSRIVDRSGDSFSNTPEWTWNVGGQYLLPVQLPVDLTFDANYRHVDSIYVGSGTSATDPFINVPSWGRLDIGLTVAKGPVSLRLFADNVTDNYIILSRWNSFNVRPYYNFIHNRVDAPRRVGATLGYRF